MTFIVGFLAGAVVAVAAIAYGIRAGKLEPIIAALRTK